MKMTMTNIFDNWRKTHGHLFTAKHDGPLLELEQEVLDELKRALVDSAYRAMTVAANEMQSIKANKAAIRARTQIGKARKALKEKGHE